MADDGEEQTSSIINTSYSDDGRLNEGDFQSDDGALVQESEQLPRLEFKSAFEDPLAAAPDTRNETDRDTQPESCLPVVSPDEQDSQHEEDTPAITTKPDLEGSTSSGDIPKSKLEIRVKTKRLDLECPIAGPGRRRNISPSAAAEEEEFIDLKVTITDREKQGVKNDAFISYKVCTETTRPKHLYEETQYEVWRRYRDFEWLRDQFEKKYTTLIVPPLPGKQLARYFDHMSDEFLRERQKALEKFLWRLAVHPYFSFDSNLKLFLTADPEAFATHMAESSSSSKFLDLVSTSMRQATTALKLKNPDPEFAKEAKYFAALSEKVSVVERVGIRLHTERDALVGILEDFSSGFFEWAATETLLVHMLQKVANCIEKNDSATKSLNDANAVSLLAASREYQLYCSSASAAIKRRDALQLEQERTADERERKKKAHDEAVTAGKIQKVGKLASDLQKCGLAAEKALDNLSQANEQLRVDIEKWHEAKNREISSLMRQVADHHVDYHEKCFNEWDKALKMLKTLGTPEREEAEEGVEEEGSLAAPQEGSKLEQSGDTSP